MNHASESALVAIITTLVAISCLGVIYRFRSFIVRERLFIPYVCLTWSIIAIVVTAVVASAQSDPAEGIFTTKSWFSYGWNTGMSMFSIRINTWNRYLAVIIYQVLFCACETLIPNPSSLIQFHRLGKVVRSILGSLLVNVFRSYLLVSIQSGQHTTDARLMEVLGAQAAYNIFVFYSSLTDSYIMLSQVRGCF